MARITWLIVGWMLFSWTAPMLGAPNSPLPGWQRSFEGIEAALNAQNYDEAAKAARKLVDEMVERLAPGSEAHALLALAVTRLAAAEAGQGKSEDALWHWATAQSLQPIWQSGEIPASLGPAAELFATDRPETAEVLPHESLERTAAPLAAPVPAPPEGLMELWYRHSLTLELAINERGRVTRAAVPASSLPGKTFLVLEAVRSWRFRPAERAGQPVASRLTVETLHGPLPLAFRVSAHEDHAATYRALLDGKWSEARTAVSKRLEKVGRTIPGERLLTGAEIGDLLTLKALAAAGAGELDEARWHWHLAGNFRDPFFLGDLGAFGTPGRWLEAQKPLCESLRADCTGLSLETPGSIPPRPLSAPIPPLNLQPHQPERLAVSLVVDAEGRVSEPRILAGRNLGAGYVLLGAMRDWRFEPARRGGEAVPALYAMTVHLPAEAPAAKVNAWRTRLEAGESQLAAGAFEAVRGLAKEVAEEVAAVVENGGSDLLAHALFQQARAEVGLSRMDEAVWHWQMAQNLAVELRFAPLPAGGPGAVLAAHRLPLTLEPLAGGGRSDPPSPETPRVLRERTEPAFSEVARKIHDVARIELELDGTGAPSRPFVWNGNAPGLLYSALEALRSWRFQPDAGGRRTVLELPLAPRVAPGKLSVDRWDWALAERAFETAKAGDETLAGCLWSGALSAAPELQSADLSELGPEVAKLMTVRRPMSGQWRWPFSPPEPEESPRRVGNEIQAPRKISAPLPRYPEEARRRGVQGVVIAEAIINKEGRITNTQILKGLDPSLDVQAVGSICSWRFQPATLNGQPVTVFYTLTVSFQLGR